MARSSRYRWNRQPISDDDTYLVAHAVGETDPSLHGSLLID